uniref:50S ribosomal protein L14 n=1 Tax=Bakuella subtropica TaxID=1295181 RepID=UPI0023F50A90|nr:50S ribosomal protein L14 [Bakuella subtropica]WDY80893.1 50S ribosomal protein L14 [Bakuella subtropica]
MKKKKTYLLFLSLMIFRQTWLYIADGTNTLWIQTFHLYKGFFRKTSYPGLFIRGSVKEVIPPKLEYKGFRKKNNKKGDVLRTLLVRARFSSRKKDNSSIIFFSNDAVLIKKKMDFRSKYLYGPLATSLKRKRILSLFSYYF